MMNGLWRYLLPFPVLLSVFFTAGNIISSMLGVRPLIDDYPFPLLLAGAMASVVLWRIPEKHCNLRDIVSFISR